MKTKTTTLLILMIFILMFVPITIYAENTNLAPIPAGWTTANTTNCWGIGGSPYVVYPVTWQGRTCIRLDRNPDLIAYGYMAISEADSYWLSIKPGDRIVFKVRFWAASSTVGDSNNPLSGARMGIDLYRNGRICEIGTPDGQTTYPDYPSTMVDLIVPWGSGQWVQRTIDFTVQSSYMADPWGAYTAGQIVTPQGFIPWVAGYTQYPNTEAASFYFADAELYINPGEISSEASIGIWTDKATYAKGETLTAYIQGFNSGTTAVAVRVNCWFGLPSGGTYMYETYYKGTIPASYTSPVYLWKSVTIPYSAASGTYSVNAELRNPATNALIDSDTSYFIIT